MSILTEAVTSAGETFRVCLQATTIPKTLPMSQTRAEDPEDTGDGIGLHLFSRNAFRKPEAGT